MDIRDSGYSYVMNQMCKVGTHIFMIGTYAEDYKVGEYVITDELKIDTCGYLCVILEGVTVPIRLLERIELLVCGYHTHHQVFLDRASAENERLNRLTEGRKVRSLYA